MGRKEKSERCRTWELGVRRRLTRKVAERARSPGAETDRLPPRLRTGTAASFSEQYRCLRVLPMAGFDSTAFPQVRRHWDDHELGPCPAVPHRLVDRIRPLVDGMQVDLNSHLGEDDE